MFERREQQLIDAHLIGGRTLVGRLGAFRRNGREDDVRETGGG